MSKDELLALCKYYHGEDDYPEEYNEFEKHWFDGERLIIMACESKPELWSLNMKKFDSTIKLGFGSGELIDESLSKNQRAFIFFVHCWHCDNYPLEVRHLLKTY